MLLSPVATARNRSGGPGLASSRFGGSATRALTALLEPRALLVVVIENS
jgi:hypothetical protein